MSKNDNNSLISLQIGEIKDAVSDLTNKVHTLDKNIVEHKISIENQADSNKLMCSELKRMNDILQQNTNSLIDHMHRTGLLEGAVEGIDKRLSPIEIDRLKDQAVKTWLMDQAILLAKMLGGVSAGFAIYMAVRKIFHF